MSNVLPTSPNPVQLRAMLEAMVVGDLLSPAGGPDEELTERNVRDRYLVGVLAPCPQAQPVPARSEDEDDEETPLLPDELSEDGADSEPRTLRRGGPARAARKAEVHGGEEAQEGS